MTFIYIYVYICLREVCFASYSSLGPASDSPVAVIQSAFDH